MSEQTATSRHAETLIKAASEFFTNSGDLQPVEFHDALTDAVELAVSVKLTPEIGIHISAKKINGDVVRLDIPVHGVGQQH